MDDNRRGNRIVSIVTKTAGHFIINSSAVSLSGGNVVSYRDDAAVQEFDNKSEMLAAHELQFPDAYANENGWG